MNVGQKIKELRQENGLTQEDLAEQLGVSFQAISRQENGITQRLGINKKHLSGENSSNY